jgi:hypothetical protein
VIYTTNAIESNYLVSEAISRSVFSQCPFVLLMVNLHDWSLGQESPDGAEAAADFKYPSGLEALAFLEKKCARLA